jgi:hypothetical protein
MVGDTTRVILWPWASRSVKPAARAAMGEPSATGRADE